MKATSLFRFLLIGLVVSVVISTPAAFADVISFTLNTPNAAIAGFTGPYVNVDVNRTSTTVATLTFTSLNSAGGTFTYAMGSTGLVGASVNSTNFTLTGITENGAGTAS